MFFKDLPGQMNVMDMLNLPMLSSQVILVKNMSMFNLLEPFFTSLVIIWTAFSQQLSLKLKKGMVRDLLQIRDLLQSAAYPAYHWDEIAQLSASAFLLKESSLWSFYSNL